MSKSLIVPKYPPQGRRQFDPFAVGQPVLLFDAAKGITLNGADVSLWADQSGNGNDVSQGTAADQPLWNASDADFNGQPSIEGDGVSESITAVTGLLTAQPNTIFMVYKRISGGGRFFDTSGTAARQIMYGNMTIYAGTAQALFVGDTNAHVIAFDWNAASSDAWLDGVQNTPGGSPGTLGFGGPCFFTDFGGASSQSNSKLAYFSCYPGNLSAAARKYIGKHLAARFGTTDGW